MALSPQLVDLPPLVQRAMAEATRVGFDGSSDVPFGRVLRTVADVYPAGRLCEIGTGCGVGSAWILSNLGPQATLVSIDYSLQRVTIARTLFTHDPRITVLYGEWRDMLSQGPFDLVFVDVVDAKATGLDEILPQVRPGGMILIDDVYPPGVRPPEWRAHVDPIVRNRLFHDPALCAVELALTPEESMILCTKRWPAG